jgi:hypothetical protein
MHIYTYIYTGAPAEVRTEVSYSGGAQFESRSGYRLSLLQLFMVFRSLSLPLQQSSIPRLYAGYILISS